MKHIKLFQSYQWRFTSYEVFYEWLSNLDYYNESIKFNRVCTMDIDGHIIVVPSKLYKNLFFKDNPVCGVYKISNKRYQSCITINGKKHNIGVYNTIEESVKMFVRYKLLYIFDKFNDIDNLLFYDIVNEYIFRINNIYKVNISFFDYPEDRSV